MKTMIAIAGTALLIAGCTAPGTVHTAEEPSPSPSATSAATPTPTPTPTPTLAIPTAVQLFQITVDVMEKKCFGSAGCNVTYRIEPSYSGIIPLPESGEYEITYEVASDEETVTNTFTMTGTKASLPSRERIQTKKSDSGLEGTVTKVRYRA